ncbi:hypothetical protein F442_18526, partial [Phytophthora nicotianae P10297]
TGCGTVISASSSLSSRNRDISVYHDYRLRTARNQKAASLVEIFRKRAA